MLLFNSIRARLAHYARPCRLWFWRQCTPSVMVLLFLLQCAVGVGWGVTQTQRQQQLHQQYSQAQRQIAVEQQWQQQTPPASWQAHFAWMHWQSQPPTLDRVPIWRLAGDATLVQWQQALDQLYDLMPFQLVAVDWQQQDKAHWQAQLDIALIRPKSVQIDAPPRLMPRLPSVNRLSESITLVGLLMTQASEHRAQLRWQQYHFSVKEGDWVSALAITVGPIQHNSVLLYHADGTEQTLHLEVTSAPDLPLTILPSRLK